MKITVYSLYLFFHAEKALWQEPASVVNYTTLHKSSITLGWDLESIVNYSKT